jgi:hypothetical protein
MSPPGISRHAPWPPKTVAVRIPDSGELGSGHRKRHMQCSKRARHLIGADQQHCGTSRTSCFEVYGADEAGSSFSVNRRVGG